MGILGSRIRGSLHYILLCYAMLCYVILYCTVLYCTVLYCTVLYCTVLYCTIRYDTIRYDTIRYDTILCSNYGIRVQNGGLCFLDPPRSPGRSLQNAGVALKGHLVSAGFPRAREDPKL